MEEEGRREGEMGYRYDIATYAAKCAAGGNSRIATDVRASN